MHSTERTHRGRPVTPPPTSAATPLERARLSLEGLALGDAFGDQFFASTVEVGRCLFARRLPPGPWRWTDDTQMAIALVAELEAPGAVEPARLAARFAEGYERGRGYGPAMHGLLREARSGEAIVAAAARLFGGQGSFGNGAVMRVPPLGAFFADAPERLPEEAARSARATHAHPEAAAGAIAVASATAFLTRGEPVTLPGLVEAVLPAVPAGPTRDALERVTALSLELAPAEAARRTGAAGDITCMVTTPFVLWCAARHPDDLEAALWATVAGLGDRDTHCAIVGGMLAPRIGGLPAAWLARR